MIACYKENMSLQSASLSFQHSGPTETQRAFEIDYPRLRALCTIHGLSDSTHIQSTEQAHTVFMNTYQKVFILPKRALPRIPTIPAIRTIRSPPGKEWTSDTAPSQSLEDSKTAKRKTQGAKRKTQGAKMKTQGARLTQSQSQTKGAIPRQSQEKLINHMIKALRKFPIERSPEEQRAVQRMLSSFSCLTKAGLPADDVRHVSIIAIVEAWDRGHTIFANSGFYIILRGSVRRYDPDTSLEEGPVLGVGDSLGSLEPTGEVGMGIVQCALTSEPSEILKISHSGYAKLKKEKQAKIRSLKESLIRGCIFYSHWPALSIQTLANLLTLRNVPANHMLVKEGKVSPFVGFIREGRCNILQSTRTLKETTHWGDTGVKSQESKGSRIQFVVVGMLGPMDSFGEVSVLQDQPLPCSIVTATEAQIGIIQPDAMKGLDPVTISLILQSTKATYGKMTQEEIQWEYLRQEKVKEWAHAKVQYKLPREVWRDTLFYNGIVPGSGKWTFCRGRTKPSDYSDLIV